uniref:Uncharacterized protein n=1 Tax=Ditylenchus dipsaci TaxID=166011 RepID=A0A915E0Z7_9BILA
MHFQKSEDSPVSPTGIIFELPEETVQAEKSRWAKLKTYMPTVSFNCFVTAGIKLKWGGYALENKIGFDENNYKFITNIQRKTESFWTTVNLSPTGDYSVQMQVHTAQGPGYFIYNLKPNEVNDTFVKLYNDAKAVRGTYSEKLFQKAGIVKEKLGAGGVILLSKFTSLLKKTG